jgi:hypothetical protein
MDISKIHPLWFIAAGGLITWYAWGTPDNWIWPICAAVIAGFPLIIRLSDWLAEHVYKTLAETYPWLTPAELEEIGRMQVECLEEDSMDWSLRTGAWAMYDE